MRVFTQFSKNALEIEDQKSSRFLNSGSDDEEKKAEVQEDDKNGLIGEALEVMRKNLTVEREFYFFLEQR